MLSTYIQAVEGDLYRLPPDNFHKTIYNDVSNEQYKTLHVPTDSTWSTKKGRPRSENCAHKELNEVFPERNISLVAHRGGEMKNLIEHTKKDFYRHLDRDVNLNASMKARFIRFGHPMTQPMPRIILASVEMCFQQQRVDSKIRSSLHLLFDPFGVLEFWDLEDTSIRVCHRLSMSIPINLSNR